MKLIAAIGFLHGLPFSVQPDLKLPMSGPLDVVEFMLVFREKQKGLIFRSYYRV